MIVERPRGLIHQSQNVCISEVVRAKVVPALILLSAFLLVSKSSRAQPAPPRGGIITSQAAVFDVVLHKAYVVDTLRDSISVIDISTRRRRNIQVGKSPIAIARNPSTHLLYVANHGSGTVSVIDGRSDRVTATIPVDSLPYSIAVDQQTNQIFVSSVYSDSLKIVDGVTNRVISMKAISADAIEINSGADLVYLMGYESSAITVLDLASRTLTNLPMGAMDLWAMARNPATSILYVTRVGSADVVAYDEKRHASSIIKTGEYPCAIAINTRTNNIYVVNYADQTVTVIDGKENRILATLAVGNHPQAIAVDEAANKAFVANTLDDSITVIDGSTHQIAATLSVGKNPYGVVVDQKAGVVISANQGEPSFTLVDRSALHAKIIK